MRITLDCDITWNHPPTSVGSRQPWRSTPRSLRLGAGKGCARLLGRARMLVLGVIRSVRRGAALRASPGGLAAAVVPGMSGRDLRGWLRAVAVRCERRSPAPGLAYDRCSGACVIGRGKASASSNSSPVSSRRLLCLPGAPRWAPSRTRRATAINPARGLSGQADNGAVACSLRRARAERRGVLLYFLLGSHLR